MNKQQGFIGAIAVLVVGALIVGAFWLLFSIRIAFSEQAVSGVVYNNTNNAFISGNTRFSVRASENTFVTEENRSSYCLPPDSPYIDLVNEAAIDKSIKIVVTTDKMFRLVSAPWVCADNVTVRIQDYDKAN